MKALDEYFLMVVFTLLLNGVHVFANFVLFGPRNMAVKRLRYDTVQQPVIFMGEGNFLWESK